MDSPIPGAVFVATSAVQKFHRLSRCFAVGGSRLGALLLVGACASNLVEVSELDKVPQEFDQKIAEYQGEVVDPRGAAVVTADAGPDVPVSNVVGAPIASKKIKQVKTPLVTPMPVGDAKSNAKLTTKKTSAWTPQSWPYGIGEVAEYSLRYGLIEGGVITMKVLEPKVVDGEKALHYLGNVKSTKLLELFYKVDDTIETWVTMASHLPIRQTIEQRESAQWGNRVVTFDRKKQTAKFYATTEKPNKKKKIERFHSTLDHYAQDVLGAMYFWRFVPPMERVNFAIHDRGKNWSNETIYIGTETLDLPVGKVRARRYKLKPRIQGHLKPKGDVEAWFADDDTRILVRFKASIKLGSMIGDLRKFQPGQKITLQPPRMLSAIDLNSLGEK